MTEEARLVERREYPRYSVDFPVKVHLPSGGITTVYAKDVSIGGMCVRGLPTWQADVGHKIQLELAVPEFFLTLLMEVEIVWRYDGTKMVGLKFTESEDDIIARIEKLRDLLQDCLPRPL